ncbi:type I restriction endonuclease [Aquibacillus sp. 3ASR75-54]|uniref:Type I restriction endonuclease n=1 Tax=Aquibacillus salsiterrae TaxID=2950439 RepID=A0A9X3WJU8_9BACI|nr:type I restriction endonuclease [Aquibacillus salsiterrae]MDC3418724.1 type I restriction endonuclease [Aquibacillus salsiterrae]
MNIVIYNNGLPLVVIELKSASREEVNIDDAYNS